MIKRKTIKKNAYLLSELYYYPKMYCSGCGTDHYGEGILKISIISNKEVSLDGRNILMTTDTLSQYLLSFYNIDIIPSIGYINRLVTEDVVPEMVDYEVPNRIFTLYQGDSFFNGLDIQVLKSFRNEESDILECPECTSSNISNPGYELGVYANEYDGHTYSRQGSYNESENSIAINDVQILIAHVSAEDLEQPICTPSGFLSIDVHREAFDNFLLPQEDSQEDLDW